MIASSSSVLKSKFSGFGGRLRFKEGEVYLKVTMGDTHGVAVADGVYDWANGIWCKFLTKLFLFNNPIKQLPTFHYLHNHIEFIFGIVYLE